MNNKTQELYFKGKIIREDDIIENLNFKFSIEKIYPKNILGTIRGTKDTYNKLSSFSQKSKGKETSFSIRGITEDGRLIKVKKCHFIQIKITRYPGKEFELEKELAELDAEDFLIEKKYENIPREPLLLSVLFKLDNRGILNNIARSMYVFKYDGTINVEISDEPNEIDTEIGKLSFKRYYNFLPMTFTQREGKFRYSSNSVGFEVESANSRNYCKKIERAKKIIEDYLFLISFISRKWVKWVHYYSILFTKKENKILIEQNCYQKGYHPEESRESQEEFIIEPKDFKDFLKIAYSKYVKKKDYLENILAYYITSQEEKLIPSAFLMLCITLEALVNIYAENEGISLNMKGAQLKKLRKLLKKIISDFCIKEEIEKNTITILDKLSELKRKPIKNNLESLINKYNIVVEDLYPVPENKFKFFDIRNDLLHKGEISDYYELFKESLKLQYMVERIILRILGWERNNFSTSDYPIHRFLS